MFRFEVQLDDRSVTVSGYLNALVDFALARLDDLDSLARPQRAGRQLSGRLALMTRTWRANFEDARRGVGCEMCGNQGQEDNGYGVRVLEGEAADVFLQRRQAATGYCVAIWKHGHRAEPTELTDEEATAFWLEVLRVGRAIEALFEPTKMNYQTLGNGLPHLHTHLVPRYADDPAPGEPLPFELLLGAEPIGEEEFARRVAMLRNAL